MNKQKYFDEDCMPCEKMEEVPLERKMSHGRNWNPSRARTHAELEEANQFTEKDVAETGLTIRQPLGEY